MTCETCDKKDAVEEKDTHTNNKSKCKMLSSSLLSLVNGCSVSVMFIRDAKCGQAREKENMRFFLTRLCALDFRTHVSNDIHTNPSAKMIDMLVTEFMYYFETLANEITPKSS